MNETHIIMASSSSTRQSRQTCSKAWSRRDVLEEFEDAKNDALRKTNLPLIYPTQVIYGHRISNAFFSGKSLVMFVASPQFGKTATSLQCIIDLTTSLDEMKRIHKDNVFVVTGLSDLDWKTQMQARMLPSFVDKVFHRNDIHKMVAKIKNKSDIFIVVDEVHVALQNNQSVHELLINSGIWDINYLTKHNIKILCISATPSFVLMDVNEWDANLRCTIVAKPSLHIVNYMGFQAMLDEDRIQIFDIKCTRDINMLVSKVEARYRGPKYHILRLNQKLRVEFGQVVERAGYLVSDHNCTTRLADVDSMLNSEPSRHHFIIIKSLWRASKTLCDKHIGVCMDNSNDFNCVAQGLGGRLLGYRRSRGPSAPLLFSNVSAIKQYVSWLETGADYHTCELYESNQLKIVEGSMKRKKISSLHYCEIKNVRRGTVQNQVPKLAVPNTIFKSTKLKRIGPVPCHTRMCTTYTKMTRAMFLSTFNLIMTPDTARGLREMMIRGGNDVIVSYKLGSAQTDSNLKTFFGHQKAWSAAKYHIIKDMDLRDDDNFVVIERNLEMLNSVKAGDILVAHNHAEKLIKYQVI